MSTHKPHDTTAKQPETKAEIGYLQQLQALATWLESTTLAEVEVEHNGLKLKLKKPSATHMAAAITPVAASPVVAAPQMAVESPENLFKSPLVGTFYAANSPESPALVNVGDAVKEGQVLGIVEAMKTMNQLVADRSGTVQKILVKNGNPVEFGQPLFVIA